MIRRLTVIMGICFVILTGCSGIDHRLDDMAEEYIKRVSEIEEEQNYQRYVALRDAGELNENGEYDELSKEEYQISAKEEEGLVHVTIAQNNFLRIDYFYDSELTEKIEEDSIYLNPGDKLFCSQPESNNAYSNTYVFARFQIYEFDKEGNRGALWSTAGENNLVLEIPEDYTGTELSIMPIGEYEKRNVSFSAFYYDENGMSKNVHGEWYVNDVLCAENIANVEAGDSYTVKYLYDENMYYYVSADPEPFNADVPGTVEFKKVTALSSIDDYSVQLHKLITVGFLYDNNGKNGIFSVEKNGTLVDDFNRKELKGLKAGDKLIVTTSENYRMFCSGIVIHEPEKVDGGYRYTVTIPDSNESEYVLKISKSELQVVLDDSVGYDMAFDIIAAGVSEKNCYYSKQTLNKELIIFDDTIGVEEKITIHAKEAEIHPGSAIKVDIEKKDGNDQITTEIKYILTTPGSTQIALYQGNGEVTNLNKIYKKIVVKISKVEVVEYTARVIPHAFIKVKTIDCTSEGLLTVGESIEGDRMVEVSIIPENGYYIDGKDVVNYVYMKKMKFSKYESDIDAIIEKHEVKRLYSVTLDSADSYGKVTYTLNGTPVQGTITVREEDELILMYELTDDSYEIVRESGGFWGGLNDWRKGVFFKNTERAVISLTDEIDGTTIRRSDHIEIVKKKGEE